MIRIFSFLTTCAVLIGCSHPVTLGTGSSPTVAIDAATGTVYCAWFGTGPSGETSVVVTSIANNGDAEEVIVSGETNVNRHSQAPPQVAVAADGSVYVVWTTKIDVPGRRFPASNLLIARSEDGGRTFSEPDYVNDDHADEPAGHTFHNLAVGPDGTVYVSWLDSRADAEAVTKHHMGGHGVSGHDTDVRLARSSDGGKTFVSYVVAEGACPCCRTALQVDQTGTVFLAWRQIYGESTRDVALARSVDGGRSFTTPVRVHADNWVIDGCPHSGPSMAIDSGGIVHVAWYTAAEGRVGLHYATSEDGGNSFGHAETVAADMPIAHAALATSGNETWLAWEHPLDDRIFVGRPLRTNERSEDAEFDLEPGASYTGSDPVLAAAANKTAIVWVDQDRIHLEILGSAD